MRLASIPTTFVKRCIHAAGMAAAVCAVTAVSDGLAGRAIFAQGGAAVDEDPFADELNPLGGARQKPPAPSTPAPPRQEPIPAPEKKSTPAAPQTPSPPPRPAPLPVLPVPFPDATVPAAPPGRGGPAQGGLDEEAAAARSPAESKMIEAEQLDMQGKLEEARAVLREAIDLDPKYSTAYLALGVVSRRLGDYEGAVAACSQGLLIDPLDAELYLRRGIAWFYLGMHGIALEDFEDAAGIAYDDPRPELWRGLTLIELDRPLEAINAYASSIRRDRAFMLAYLNRGLAYLSTGEPRKAEFDFDHAIRHDPRDARAWFNRGVAQARQERFADAIRSYEAALRLAPDDEPTRRNLEAARRMQSRSR